MSDNRPRRPPGPRGHWLTGSLGDLRKNPLAFFSDLTRTYGGMARFRLLHRTLYLIAHPDYARHVLVTRHGNYGRSFHYDNLKLVLGEGLICADGEVWRAQRRRAQPAFHGETLARLPETVAAYVRDMLEGWDAACREGREVDVAAEMNALSLQVIGKSLLGVDLRRQAGPFIEALRSGLQFIRRRNASLIRLPVSLPTARNRRFRKCRTVIDAFISPAVEERRRAEHPPADMLAQFLRAKDPETGAPTSERELRDQVMTVFLAGFETTANALAWACCLLSQHPDVEEKLHEELARELGGRPPEPDDLTRLSYTSQVLQETLRLYPPVFSLGRRSLDADEIGGYAIPPGASLMISVYDLHRSPDFWEEPDRFLPERFAPENAARLNRDAYIPFGAGPRKCIGAGFALLEMPIALAMVCQRYRLRLRPGHPVVAVPAITLTPRYGLPMRLENRS